MSRTAMATWLRRPIIGRSYDRDEDGANRLFAPRLGDRAADGATDRLAQYIGIAPLRPGNRIERADDRVHHCLLHRPAEGVLERQPGQRDVGIGDLIAL